MSTICQRMSPLWGGVGARHHPPRELPSGSLNPQPRGKRAPHLAPQASVHVGPMTEQDQEGRLPQDGTGSTRWKPQRTGALRGGGVTAVQVPRSPGSYQAPLSARPLLGAGYLLTGSRVWWGDTDANIPTLILRSESWKGAQHDDQAELTRHGAGSWDPTWPHFEKSLPTGHTRSV